MIAPATQKNPGIQIRPGHGNPQVCGGRSVTGFDQAVIWYARNVSTGLQGVGFRQQVSIHKEMASRIPTFIPSTFNLGLDLFESNMRAR